MTATPAPAITQKQREKLNQLEDELRIPRGSLPIRGISREGYVFTEVDGVTVVVTLKSYNPRGGYKLPSVRTYDETVAPTNLDAAVRARQLFDDQERENYTTGHLGSIVDTDWKCRDASCDCKDEPYARRMKRSLGS